MRVVDCGREYSEEEAENIQIHPTNNVHFGKETLIYMTQAEDITFTTASHFLKYADDSTLCMKDK